MKTAASGSTRRANHWARFLQDLEDHASRWPSRWKPWAPWPA